MGSPRDNQWGLDPMSEPVQTVRNCHVAKTVCHDWTEPVEFRSANSIEGTHRGTQEPTDFRA